MNRVPLILAIMGVPLWGCMQASPPGSAMPDSSAEAPSQTASLRSSQIDSLELPAPVAKPLPTTPRLSAETVATIGPQDTLYTVARAHNVPIRDLIQWNGLDVPYDVKPGQVLRLPPTHDHLVASGETVYSISRRYNVDMTELVRTNDIAAPYSISDGQRLKLPAATLNNTPGNNTPASNAPPSVSVEASAAPSPANSAGKAVTETPLPPTPPQSNVQTASLEPQVSPPATPLPAPESKPKSEADLEIAPTPKPDMFVWPIRGKILSGYGAQKGGLHNDGINIAAARGAPVRAAADGTVIYAGNELRGFGNLILIKHANGWTTAYAHNDRLLVARGDAVKAGQVIAKAGSTGSVGTPQVHFEIRRGTHAVNPGDYLSAGSETASTGP